MEAIQELIGYRFSNLALLEEALTHPSLGYEGGGGQGDNQRLEFLGDAIIDVIVSEELFRRYPTEREGFLTKARACIVSRPALAAYARKLDLGTHIKMGKGEIAAGGRKRDACLADCIEAVVGAIYLDGGATAARGFFLPLCESDFGKVGARSVSSNPKGELQEILQGKSAMSPEYEILQADGPDHLRVFVARVVWEGEELGRGEGKSKKVAETRAAESALESQVIELARLDKVKEDS